jgi:hypothetical protein
MSHFGGRRTPNNEVEEIGMKVALQMAQTVWSQLLHFDDECQLSLLMWMAPNAALLVD